MGLMKKLVISISLITIVVFAGFYALSHRVLLGRFQVLDESSARSTFNQLEEMIHQQVNLLDKVCIDWAQWNDTHSYMMDQNSAFEESNITETIFLNQPINVLAFFFPGGECMKIFRYDLNHSSFTLDTAKLKETLQSTPCLWQHMDNKSVTKGLLYTEEGTLMLSARPVLNSDGAGEIRGTLLFGRFLDAREIGELSKHLHQNFLLIANRPTLLPGTLPVSLHFLEESRERMRGRLVLNDILGQPALHVEATLRRSVYLQGLSTVRIINLYLLFTVFGFLLFLLLLFRFHLVAPVLALMTGAKRLTAGESAYRVNDLRSDELGQLGHAFNEMADQIESYQQFLEAKVEERTAELEASNEQLMQEIEERSVIEKNLERSEKTYRTIFSNTGTAMAILDDDDRILLANSRLADLLQLPLEEIEGKIIWTDTILLDDMPLWLEHVTRSPFSSQTPSPPLHLRLKDFRDTIHHVHTEIAPLPASRQRVASLIDITPLKESQEALIRSTQLAAVGTLASGVAHQFNNINSAVLGYAELLLEEDGIKERTRTYLGRIVSAAQRAKSITHNLLSFSGAHSSTVNTSCVNSVIEDTVSIVRDEFAKEEIELVLDLQAIPDSLLDSPRIAQVILHLLINACHSLTNRPGKRISVSSALVHHTILIKVMDNGCGISKSDLVHIFTPFFSTKGEHGGAGSAQQSVKGTGLGLSVCDTIVKQHSGEIKVESEVNQGTTVTITLPWICGSEDSPLPADVPVTQESPRSRKVLVIEDEPDVRDLIGRFLHSRGIECQLTDDGHQALERCKTDCFGLILVDVQMPKMSGTTFIRLLQDHPPQSRPPCLIITGRTSENDINAMHEFPGCCGAITKPFELGMLYMKVCAALGINSAEPMKRGDGA